MPASDSPGAAPQPNRRRFTKRHLAATFALGAVCSGLVFAVVGTNRAARWQSKVDAVQADLDAELAAHGETSGALEAASAKVATSDARIGEAEARADEAEQQLADSQAALEERESELAQREADVTAREESVSATEQHVKDNTFGDGIWKVGDEIAPGTYRNSGGSATGRG